MTLLSRYWIRHFTKSLWWALAASDKRLPVVPERHCTKAPRAAVPHALSGWRVPDPGTAGSAVRLSGKPSRRTLWTGLPERTALSFRLTPHPTGSPSRSFNAPPSFPFRSPARAFRNPGDASLGPRAAFRLHLSIALRIQRFSRCAPSGGRSRALSVPYAHPGRFSRPQTEKRWIYGSLDGISNGSQGTQKNHEPGRSLGTG